MIHLYEMPRICKSTETESNCLGSERCRRKWGVIANGYNVSFGGDENVLKLSVIMFAQFCEYTKSHFVHFE